MNVWKFVENTLPFLAASGARSCRLSSVGEIPDSSPAPAVSIPMALAKSVLGLHPGQTCQTTTGTSEADALRCTLDEAFRTLADALSVGDVETLDEVMSAAGRCRAELAAGIDADAFDPLARSCFQSMRHVAAQTRDLAAEQRTQIAALVATVRETVKTIAGDHATLQDTLTGSATRFERLTRVDDLQLIQAELVEEVSTLARITIERRAAWEQTSQEFGTRLASLETQLDDTRREAAIDPLTNVANRRTFERACCDWLQPNRPNFVMAMVEVDDFKSINDQYGHAVGDQVRWEPCRGGRSEGLTTALSN